MLIVLVCVCLIFYILWNKLPKEPPDAPPKLLNLIKSFKLYLQNTGLFEKFEQLCGLTLGSDGVGYGMLGFKTIYGVSDPEDCLTVIKASAEKSFLYDFLKPWLGEGLFTGAVSINKVHRKLFLPMLFPKKLDSFIKDFNEQAKRFVPKMSSRAGEPPFDILRDLLIYNLELLCTTLFILPDMHKDYNFNPYCDNVASFLRIATKRAMNIFYHNEAIYAWSNLKKEQDKALEVLHRTSTNLIERRRKLYYKEVEEKKASGEPVDKDYIDILDEAVKNGILTETEMREEIDTIIFGGHDTTAFTTLYALVLLGSHPQVQEKVYEEVQGILGNDKDVNITKEDMSKMVYLEASIKESMRLYPYAAVVARTLDKDIKLRTCTFRKGGTALVFVWGAHRHSSWGPDVHQYRPERWLEPDKLPRPTALLGFSEGPRACIGRKYAMLSMKALLAHLVRHYRIRADHTQIKFELVGVLESKSGHQISLEKRT